MALDPDKMKRPLSEHDREWLRNNNMVEVADRFDREDGVGVYGKRDYDEMTVEELKTEIERRNDEIVREDPDAEPLSTSGKKAELIQRLKDDDEAVADNE